MYSMLNEKGCVNITVYDKRDPSQQTAPAAHTVASTVDTQSRQVAEGKSQDEPSEEKKNDEPRVRRTSLIRKPDSLGTHSSASEELLKIVCNSMFTDVEKDDHSNNGISVSEEGRSSTIFPGIEDSDSEEKENGGRDDTTQAFSHDDFELGQGGGGAVYRAVHKDTGKEKLLQGIAGSKSNKTNQSKLQIDNLYIRSALQTEGGKTDNGDTFLVLDYVDGEDLSSWLDREAATGYGVDTSKARVPTAGEGCEGSLKTLCGTVTYMAPEVLQQMQCMAEPRQTKKTDVWGLGMILHEMLIGSPPECAERPGKDGRFPEPKLSRDIEDKEATDLIRRCLSVNPRHRPLCTDILQHPWLKHDDNIAAKTSSPPATHAMYHRHAEDLAGEESSGYRLRLSSSPEGGSLSERVYSLRSDEDDEGDYCYCCFCYWPR
ncbi:hypothetical protein FOL47_008113 [Perkinsus chesapeaki]|uniref:Protein kinase domain-containing protein n=1 Tax=Perkinsus chesapeaki TaxID=330153 RepID=A0A7J6LGE9_PERCH|nr:hypothetical protein FOL47_008113 [Perkinsus chesapeaki]